MTQTLRRTRRAPMHTALAGAVLGLVLAAAGPAQAGTVTLTMNTTITDVSPGDTALWSVGGLSLERIAYDDTQIDPLTGKVPLTYLAHWLFGNWSTVEPTAASSYDTVHHTLDFVASVVHGEPIVVLYESSDQRMAILSRPDFAVHIAGNYVIDPTPLTAAEIAAKPVGWDSPNLVPHLPVSPVPEPGTAALLLAGAGVLGLAMRRRGGPGGVRGAALAAG